MCFCSSWFSDGIWVQVLSTGYRVWLISHSFKSKYKSLQLSVNQEPSQEHQSSPDHMVVFCICIIFVFETKWSNDGVLSPCFTVQVQFSDCRWSPSQFIIMKVPQGDKFSADVQSVTFLLFPRFIFIHRLTTTFILSSVCLHLLQAAV